jgi:hypothetical protein
MGGNSAASPTTKPLPLLLHLLLFVLAVILTLSLSKEKDPETFHSLKPIGPFSP